MRHKGAIALAGLMLALAVCATAVYRNYLPAGRTLVGTKVAGEAQPAQQSIDAWLTHLQERLKHRELRLDAVDSQLHATFEQLGVELDVGATKRALIEHATHGTVLTRLQRAFEVRRRGADIAPYWTFDMQRATRYMSELAPALARDAQDAKVDLENHLKVPDVSGRELQVAASSAAVELAVTAGVTTVQLLFRPVPATTTLADLIRVDVSKVLASYETDFKGKAGRRKVNIERAVKYLNGTVIEPGDTFSFNRTVGVRTEARGFVNAPVIVDDVMEAGVGGGVCQVASTLFAASVYGNLEAVRRRSHSRPSGYAPLGLDAAVIDNEVDLRLKNPYDVPLLIHAFLPTETTIKVELLGHSLEEKIEHQYGVTERYDFVRRVKHMPDVTEPKRKQKGNHGYDVVSVVSIAMPGGKKQRKTYPSKYYPVPEVYWVPPDYDLALLPELPEGATETIVGDKPVTNEAEENASGTLAEPPS